MQEVEHMKFSSEKRNAIIQYILEKIAAGTPSLSKCVAETFDISQNTVHEYLSEMLEKGIISKEKRGEYVLVQKQYVYTLKRSRGELNSDTYAYDQCLHQHIEDLSDNVKRIWSYAMSEMVNNVMDHSGAENLHILIIKDFLNTQVAIIDDGIGIFKKIMDHFSLATLEEAIGELFKGKLTTDAENHSGEGIFFTSRIMDKFFISSSQRIFATTRFQDDTVAQLDRPREGTCVFMALSNFTHKEIRDVFDQFSNEEGGFTKTALLMKNYFDTSPVSRSQAKRISTRLDQFEEVTLDFEGIDWMGQGFAHQLFVVFQKAHPAIKLIPINMSEGVQSMYRHVIHT